MATVEKTRNRRLVLDSTTWKTYSRMLRALEDRPSIRLTYDRGVLEIICPLLEHESYADLLARFVVVLTEELGLPIKAAGSTTLRRRRHRRGLEADRAWWIANEKSVRGKIRIDLRSDPPPDLALEIEVSRSALDRMAIYAALRVPEVWRYNIEQLTFHHLATDGTYQEKPTSLAFPGNKPGDLLPFLELRSTHEENALVAQFRKWVRDQVAKAKQGC